MSIDKTKYFLKIKAPKKGTITYFYGLVNEFGLYSEEYWEKKDDPDIKLYTRPVYEKSFTHTILVYDNKIEKIDFIKYLVHKYIETVESLENTWELDENGNKPLPSIKKQFEKEFLDFNKKLPKEISITNASIVAVEPFDEQIAFNGTPTFNGEQIHDIIERTFNEKIAQYRRTSPILLIDIPERELLISIKNKYLILIYEGLVNAKEFTFNILSKLKDTILQKINRISGYIYRKK
jgi:hypothetical protein